MSVVSLLFIIIWPAAGGDTVCIYNLQVLKMIACSRLHCIIKFKIYCPDKHNARVATHYIIINICHIFYAYDSRSHFLLPGITGVLVIWLCGIAAECVCECGVLQREEVGS